MFGSSFEFLSNNKIAADIFKIKQILTAVKTAVCYDNELLEVISFLYFSINGTIVPNSLVLPLKSS